MDASMPHMEESERFFLQQVYLLLTRKCNITCTHCIRSSTPYHREMMDKSLAMLIMKKLHRFSDQSTLLISGGEPSLHPDFKSIVHAGCNQFLNVVINTNGLRLSQLLDACKNVGASVQISIDGDMEQHELIRGTNTFRRTLNNAKELSRNGIPVVIATTVTRHNIKSLKRLDEELTEVPFNQWVIKRVVGYGRSSDNDDVSTENWNSFVSSFHALALNRERINISFMFSDKGILGAWGKELSPHALSNTGANCGTGRSKLYINPDGTVYPCACMEDKIVGSLATSEAADILRALGEIEIEPEINSVCRRCPAWKVCRGGCPGAAFRTNYSGFGDPRCTLAEAGRRDNGIVYAS